MQTSAYAKRSVVCCCAHSASLHVEPFTDGWILCQGDWGLTQTGTRWFSTVNRQLVVGTSSPEKYILENVCDLDLCQHDCENVISHVDHVVTVTSFVKNTSMYSRDRWENVFHRAYLTTYGLSVILIFILTSTCNCSSLSSAAPK